MAIFYSLCYCLPETVIFETEEVHRKLVGRVSIPTSSCLSSSWIHVGALRFKTSARYLHDLIGTWRSWFVSHTIRICAIYGLPFTINIPQMLAYIPYMDPMGYGICFGILDKSHDFLNHRDGFSPHEMNHRLLFLKIRGTIKEREQSVLLSSPVSICQF